MPTEQQIKQWIADAVKWHRHDGVLTQLVYLFQVFGFRQRWAEILETNELSFQIIVDSNGTTPVFVFGNGVVPGPFRIESIYIISLDTTAGTITFTRNGTDTVATIAKGVVSGAMVGAVSLTNREFEPGDTLSFVSSSAGNVRVSFNFLYPNN